MPTFQVPVRLTWAGSGSPGANVWHMRADDTTVLIDTTAWAAGGALKALRDFYTALLAFYPSDTTITIGDNIVNVADQTVITPSEVAVLQGTGGINKMSPASQIVVGWQTSVAARRARGRTFIGPLSQLVCDSDGTPTPSSLAAVRTAATDLVTASSAVNLWAYGVYGKDTSALGSPKVLRDFTGAKVRDTFAVLRSRRD